MIMTVSFVIAAAIVVGSVVLDKRTGGSQDTPEEEPRIFECFFNFLGWQAWCQCGLHIDWQHPHLDLHVPFGFLRVGWYSDALCWKRIDRAQIRHFGKHRAGSVPHD